MRKRNEKNEIIKHNAKLITQKILQRLGLDYDEAYSPVMDGIIFRYLVNLAIMKNLTSI